MIKILPLGVVLAMALGGCGRDGGDDAAVARDATAARPAAPVAADSGGATLANRGYETISPEQLERGRFDTGWRSVVQLDSVSPGDTARSPEKWEQISPQTVNRRATFLPLHGDVAGPSVLTVQILLDRALFSPGVIDGRWGKNTEIAIYWLQRREGLPATGRVDRATFDRLRSLAGQPQELVRVHRLTEEDVEGPFVDIPEDIYEKAELDCMCYESVGEKLAEMFHTTPELLEKLNPEVSLDSAAAGTQLRVPAVRDQGAAQNVKIARLVVSARGHYVHAVDSAGRVVLHFPTTMGSTYDPSPTGDFKVTRITKDPWWHYQPSILEHVDSSDPEAKIPPGPNNAVGKVWMALSAPHYGIHGTSAPETIGYATSAGCVRLTNWDAIFLADRLSAGVPVEFQTGAAAGAKPS